MIRDAISAFTIFGLLWAAFAFQAALEPCPTEDSGDCYWNAAEQGNGEGQSFFDRAGIILRN